MSTQVNTIRVTSTDPETQGPFVVINESDFDPQLHTVYDPEAQAKAAEAERLAAVPQPEAAQAAEAPATTTAATPARKRAGSTTPTTEA